MPRHPLALPLALLPLLAGPGLAQNQATSLVVPVTVATARSAEHGPHLTDGDGRALYLFEGDRRGGGGRAAASSCEDDCLASWPPLTSRGAAEAAGGARPELLGVVVRDTGLRQVTYAGWPLHYFHGDAAPGETNGHGLEAFGAGWHLVDPEGGIAGEEGPAADR